LKRYDNVQVIAADTHDTARSFDRTVDTLYVDSDHAKFHIVRELLGWLPHVRPGGIVSGHDYLRDWPEVVEAIYEVFWQPPHYVYGDGTWAYVMPQNAGGRASRSNMDVATESYHGDSADVGRRDAARLLAQVDRQAYELGAAYRLLEQRTVEVERLLARLAGREDELAGVRRQLGDILGRLTYMLESFSWKITAPLRAVRTHLKPSRSGTVR
jgi:hypothetical protein